MNASINTFTSSLYSKISSLNAHENVFFSPASIFAALSMTYCGARANTAEQMKIAMKLPENPENLGLHEDIMKIWDTLNQSIDGETVSLSMANRIWVEETYSIETSFQDVLLKYYQADAALVDFKNNPEFSRKNINEWVADKTNKKIKDLLLEGSISSLTRLVIANAIYFKGNWASAFKKNHTKEMKFHTSSSESHAVSMMYQRKSFSYIQENNYKCKVIVLPYVGCSVNMIVVLPDDIEGLNDVEAMLLQDGLGEMNIQKWVKSGTTETEVFLPKFKFSQGYDLVNVLQNVGIIDLFSESRADLSGISGNNDLYISAAVHKAFVEVNEEGTEAAAATAMVANARCMRRYPRFQADHPFMFILYDKSSQTILFIGRVYKP